MSSPTTITVKSSDGENFELEETVAKMSQTIKHMIDDNCANNVIPLPNVTGKILTMVIEYCKRHLESLPPAGGGDEESSSANDLKKFDSDFVNIELGTLFDLINAANYLDIRSLLDLSSQAVANRIKDMSPEEVREVFNVENDFTSEEEEKIRNENAWAFK